MAVVPLIYLYSQLVWCFGITAVCNGTTDSHFRMKVKRNTSNQSESREKPIAHGKVQKEGTKEMGKKSFGGKRNPNMQPLGDAPGSSETYGEKKKFKREEGGGDMKWKSAGSSYEGRGGRKGGNYGEKKKFGKGFNPNMEPLGNGAHSVSSGSGPSERAQTIFDRFKELDDAEDEEMKKDQSIRKKTRKDTYQKAKEAFDKIQQEKREEAERKAEERVAREKALQEYLSTKKKMNQALKKKNRNGQPKLNAQITVLLEKIQKSVKK